MKRYFFTVTLIASFFILSVNPATVFAQKTFNYGLELTGTAGSSEFLPFWLYSNQRGEIDPNTTGGNAVLNFHKNLTNERSGFDYGFGARLVNRRSTDETIFFNELYAKFSYGAFQLTGGRFFEQTGTVDQSLSMGSLTTSRNATPLPKIKISIPEYTPVPLTNGFLEIKGALAHGWFEEDRIVEKAWLHEKYAYLRFGGDWALKPYAGLVHQVTWAGETDTEGDIGDSFADFFNVFFALSGGEDTPFGDQLFKQGDHRGIWDFGFYLTLADIDFNVYRQFIYNDKDGVKLQVPQDGLLGVSVDLPAQKQQLVTGFLWEYLYTKNQSGSACPGNQRDAAGGCDNYYNNFFYRSGWTYAGNTIGNPLFLPVNAPGIDQAGLPAGISNNRIVAHHLGLEGKLSSSLDYKLLGTWSRNSGLYDNIFPFQNDGPTDFDSTPEQWSFLARFSYQPDAFGSLRFNTSLAGDFGDLYEDRVGIMVGIELLGSSDF
jgi:hypothetical protein